MINNKSVNMILTIFFLIFISVFISYIRFNFISLPLDSDEGTYAYIASNMYTDIMPYRDVFDHKPPGIYFIYQTAFNFFGKDLFAIRAFSIIYVIFTMIAVFITSKKMFNTASAVLSALLYSIYQNSVCFQGVNANTEVFLGLPLMISFYCICGRNKISLPKYFLSGFFFGVAFFIKEMVVFWPLFLFAGMALEKKKIADYFAFICGAVVCGSLVLAWILYNGLFFDYFRYEIMYNIFYVKNNMINFNLPFWHFVQENVLLVIALLYLLYAACGRKADNSIRLLVLFNLSLIMGVVILKGLFPHYYLVLYPALCVTAGVSLVDIYTKTTGFKKILLAFFTVIFALPFFVGNWEYYGKTAGEISGMQYGTSLFYESKLFAEFVNKVKKKDTTLFVYPVGSMIYFMTDIKSPVRQINFLYPYSIFDSQDFANVLRLINSNKPDIIIVEIEKKQDLDILLKNYKSMYKSPSLELFVIKH